MQERQNGNYQSEGWIPRYVYGGTGGPQWGFALLWQDVQCLEIQNITRHHINALVSYGDNGENGKLTCFYGHLVTAMRHESWALLEHLKQFRPQPWVCISDFNEILTQGEKTSVVLRKER